MKTISDTCIMIVEDEPRVVNLLREVLGAMGYMVIATFSGQNAVKTAALEQPDLILLDIILPGPMDGYQVTRRLREFTDTPIIMLTAKVRESDILRGFEAGADDYITKPFSSKVLLARISAVLKRNQASQVPSTPVIIVCGDLTINLARRQVILAGREIYLTPTEYSLLYQLATHPNQVMLHEQLLETVWGPEYRGDVDYLRSYIHYLRRKLEKDPTSPCLILSSPGIGYMLSVPDQDQSEIHDKYQLSS